MAGPGGCSVHNEPPEAEKLENFEIHKNVILYDRYKDLFSLVSTRHILSVVTLTWYEALSFGGP